MIRFGRAKVKASWSSAYRVRFEPNDDDAARMTQVQPPESVSLMQV